MFIRINLGAIWESVQPQCAEARLHYSAPGSLYMGPASLSMPRTEDGELEAGVLIAPLIFEVSMSVTCRDEIIKFSCKPRQTSTDSPGDVGCETQTGEMRRGRDLDELREVEEKEVSAELSSVIHSSKKTTEDFLQDAAENFDSIIGSWQKLTPSVVGCFSSLAGQKSTF